MIHKYHKTFNGKACVEYVIPRLKLDASGLGIMGVLAILDPWSESIDVSKNDEEIYATFDNRIPNDIIEGVLGKLLLTQKDK